MSANGFVGGGQHPHQHPGMHPGQLPGHTMIPPPSPTGWHGKSIIESMLAQGRRNSAARILQRFRSGSLSGWASQHLNPFKGTHFPTGEADPENHESGHHHGRLPARFRRMSVDPAVWRRHGNASLGSVLSALYAKLLVVMGIAFPMSEVISTYVPPAFYDGFYLYLYFVSILFMGWLFSHVIKSRAKREITRGVASIKSRLNTSTNKSVNDDTTSKSDDEDEELENDELIPEKVLDPQGPELEKKSPEKRNDDHDTHSEDSDDKLSPLPTEEHALPTQSSPLLLHRPTMPVPTLVTSHSANSLYVPPPQPAIVLQPINHHLHHHPPNLHVTINSVPGHDALPTNHIHHHHHIQMQNGLKNTASSVKSENSDGTPKKGKLSRTQSVESSKYDTGRRSHFGSFYLRMGAVAFGVGSMIYSCLEFGQFLEQEKDDEKCYSYLQMATPIARVVFTFMQMYFIFLNSRMSVSKVSWIKQFGLMHLIGTNLCVWLNVLVQETKHEILHFYDPENETITVGYGLHYYGKAKKLEEHAKVVAAASSGSSIASALVADPHDHDFEDDDDMFISFVNRTVRAIAGSEGGHEVLSRMKRGLKGPHSMYECGRKNIIGGLVNSASPFLFPCTIEYSLICAAICYVMWKSMAKRRARQITLKRTLMMETTLNQVETRNVHHYTVDCAGSNKGLFIGIFFLVFTIMSLILNFVLMKHHEHLEFAFWEVNLTEITLYAVSTLAVLIGMIQMRQLRYESGKNLELDNILLIVAQSGSFMFNVFCIVGGHLTPLESNIWILLTPLLCLIQLLLQTLFILDASKRVVSTPELGRRKPGREIVTFLLVTNLAMWLINALEKSRGDSHPHLLRFYGVWAWTIITDISMPLAIFYRFHSTVCLCEIWKKAYKARKFAHEPMMHI